MRANQQMAGTNHKEPQTLKLPGNAGRRVGLCGVCKDGSR